jgi:hypothetical protein
MSLFIRLLESEDKAAALKNAVVSVAQGHTQNGVYTPDTHSFAQVPGSPFAYWVSDQIREIFTKMEPFNQGERTAKQGLATADDFRFVRLWTEVASEETLDGQNGPDWQDTGLFQLWCRNRTQAGKRWVNFAKGGAYSPYFADPYLVLHWGEDGKEMKAWADPLYNNSGWSRIIKSVDFYFRPGLTWSRRSQIGLSMRSVPVGCIFADKGPVAFTDFYLLLPIVGIFNSEVFKHLIGLQMAFGSYEVGVINRTPIPHFRPEHGEKLTEWSLSIVKLKQKWDTHHETSHLFVLPVLAKTTQSFAQTAQDWQRALDADEAQIQALQAEIDQKAYELYQISENDQQALAAGFGQLSPEAATEENEEDLEPATQDAKALLRSFLAWGMGLSLGRWDLRYATGQKESPALPEPFAPLPVCSPGMLQETPSDYPLSLPSDGILVDDPGHSADWVGRLQQVFGLIWPEHQAERWAEATQLLTGRYEGDLRQWLRSQFFQSHIKTYSKSRRKAPIYWQLATPSGSYAVWLYYHRLSKDSLYKVLDHVLLKIKHEEGRLSQWQSEAGDSPTRAQSKTLEEQDKFLEELYAFRDEVARVAPLWNPNLNDGVQLNFAPLWRLVPQLSAWQKVCKDTWDKLAAGEYDWAHLALHLWPERVIPKCSSDRSLAIAHGLEAVFWMHGPEGKAEARPVSAETLQSLIAERSSAAVQAALQSLMAAPVPEKTKRSKKS